MLPTHSLKHASLAQEWLEQKKALPQGQNEF